MAVSLRDLDKRYEDGTTVLKGLSLDICEGEFFTLLGPSGCGKTTLLRLIAGLEELTGGSISINGRDVTRVDPGDRDIAMVFQSYALYPHLTVFDNLTLNLRARGVSKADAKVQATDTARLLGIEHLLQKKPGKLSGGERQRVALGRAIIRKPTAFLLDEPLSNLDLKLREQMRTELKRLHQRLRITTVYVTHDQSEALTMSDRLAVMKGGVIQQIGAPTEVYDHPANLFVAEFIGSPSINLIRGRLSGDAVEVANSRLSVKGAPTDGDVLMGIRPEDLLVGPHDGGVLNATVDLVEPNGSLAYLFLTPETEDAVPSNREHLIATVDVHSAGVKGDSVGLNIRDGRMSLFDAGTGINLRSPAGTNSTPLQPPGSADSKENLNC
jgi:ABC-type sugar transport system ATPase subunit